MDEIGPSSSPPAAISSSGKRSTGRRKETSILLGMKKGCLSFAVSFRECFRYMEAFCVGKVKWMSARNEKEAAEAQLQADKMQVNAADEAENNRKKLEKTMLPSWPYVKGIATFMLVVPYFGGASCVYKHFVSPYLSESPLIWSFSIHPGKKCSKFCAQDSFVDVGDSNAIEGEQENFENAIFQGIFEPNHNNAEWQYSLSMTPNKVQNEWSCALCRVSASNEKCLKRHLRGKRHKAEEEMLRAEQVQTSVAYNSSLTVKQNNSMVFIGSLVSVEKWSGLLTPIARSIRWCTWKKPDIGWIKLNTDGSNTGFGGLFRDHKGDAICAFVSKAPSRDNIFLVELWAIWRGLVLALGLGIKVLWVESDSESIVKTINRQQPYSGKAADSCLKQIQELLKGFKKYKVSHSWRETNKAADCLSKMVFLDRNDVVLWPKDFPNNLHNIIKGDADGKIYRRQ